MATKPPRFGTADEFNRLGGGQLVRLTTLLGPRPTFLLVPIMGGHKSTVLSALPSLDSATTGGTDWLDQPGATAGLVVVPGDAPCRLIANLPRLRSTPAPLTPVLPNNVPRERWNQAGLGDDQAPIWSSVNHQFEIRLTMYGLKWRYMLNDPHKGIELAPGNYNLEMDGVPYTKGILIDPAECDLASIRLRLEFVRLGNAFLDQPA